MTVELNPVESLVTVGVDPAAVVSAADVTRRYGEDGTGWTRSAVSRSGLCRARSWR